ncbi:MAG: RhuM family protein, partial [Bacteroidales bacterium]
ATVSKMEIVQTEGSRNVKRLVDFYNLDAIISVGYRVNSSIFYTFASLARNAVKCDI